MVFFAFIISAPIAWWIMDSYLDRYAYRIDIPLWILPVAGAVVFDIPESVPVVRERHPVVARDELGLSPRYALPSKLRVIHRQVAVLGKIFFAIAEKGEGIQDAITHFDDKEAKQKGPKQ